MFKKRKALVLGDSHTAVFRSKFIKILLPRYNFTVHTVKGATVSGLENPNSKTNAANIFKEAIKKHNRLKNVIFLLGEVDTGFVIWYRAQKYNTSIEEMLTTALNNYRQLLLNDDLKGKNLIVISAPLPTIPDNSVKGEVADARKEVKATIKERTELTLRFNSLLEKIVKELGYQFVNLDKLSVSNDNSGAKKILRSFNDKDHHYNKLLYSILILLKVAGKIK